MSTTSTPIEHRAIPGLGWIIPIVLLVLLVVAWEIAVRLSQTPAWILPPPSKISAALADNWRVLLHHSWVTLEETLIGLGLSFACGVATATVIASSRSIERSVYPIVVASQAIPIIALAPILLIWFGYGLAPKVIVILLFCFFPITVNTIDGFRAVDQEQVDLLRSLGASRWFILRTVRLPSALPYVLSGTRIAAAVSVVGALVGEWVGSSAGLGYYMIRSASAFATDKVFAAILITAVIGIALFLSVTLLERLLMPWQRVSEKA
ncbi:MAG TPA: ABC transporter permease [Thermomicrobiaceae bacterium]|nr:ABC transporter permease [Thermomicrobiaceae bacterium]